MRWSTPNTRVLLKGDSSSWPASFQCINGNQYMRKPNRNMISVRFNIFHQTVPADKLDHFSMAKLIAFPTANKKDGNTRSVGVKPCQWACCNGEKLVAPLPGVFTMIIKQTVMPRNTSNAVNLSVAAIVSLY